MPECNQEYTGHSASPRPVTPGTPRQPPSVSPGTPRKTPSVTPRTPKMPAGYNSPAPALMAGSHLPAIERKHRRVRVLLFQSAAQHSPTPECNKEDTGDSALPRPVFCSASDSQNNGVTSTVPPGASPSLTPGTPKKSPSVTSGTPRKSPPAGFHSPARTLGAGSHRPEIERKRKPEKEPKASSPPGRKSLKFKDCETSQDSVSQSP